MVSANPPWRHQYYTPEGLPSKPPFEMGVANFDEIIETKESFIEKETMISHR